MNGAEALLRTLEGGGVPVCFANPGTSEMRIVDASARVPGIRFVPCLFEDVATGAADGFARVSRRPAATLLHLGPGLANGLANLHNARKAGSPIVNLVGEHPAYHRVRQTPLGSDVEGLARPVSDWVRTVSSPATLANDAADAVTAAKSRGGQVATLAIPADTAWTGDLAPAVPNEPTGLSYRPENSFERAVQFLRRDAAGTAILVGGAALFGEGLALAGELQDRTGATLLTPFPLARLERGQGRPPVRRLPYPREAAATTLKPFSQFVLVGTEIPYGYFVHPDDDGTLFPHDARVALLAERADDIIGCLQSLVEIVPAGGRTRDHAIEVGAPAPGWLGDIARIIAGNLPADVIVVDEGMTSGRTILAASVGAPRHDWLGNTGGSIGIALPLATGAALACPDRPVLCLSADGSAAYTLQALWTMAREQLAVTIVLFANNAYALLKHEYARVRGERAASQPLLDLDRPPLDWVALARGFGVRAQRVQGEAELTAALRECLDRKSPSLIEVPC